VCAAALGVGDADAGNPQAKQAEQQMKWGYKAAKRGYWLEALDRFERANRLTPDQPRILNNIAVALEASGRFEEALLEYESALNLAPNDRVLRRNYSLFKEFYDTRVAPPPDEPEEKEAESEQQEEQGDRSDENEDGEADDGQAHR
jgi:tetratricopeptide (TPR) repeat protein